MKKGRRVNYNHPPSFYLNAQSADIVIITPKTPFYKK